MTKAVRSKRKSQGRPPTAAGGTRGGGRRTPERILQGLGVAPGIAIGPAQVREAGDIPIVEYRLPAAKLAAEVSRFQDAVAQAGRQVDKLKAKAERLHGAAAEELGYLFDAHQQMLSSRRLLEGIEKRIIGDRRNAEAAVMAELAEIARSFEEMEDPYLRSRGQEVREVGHRILRNLTASGFHSFENLPQDSIVIAEEITPADTALMDPEQVGGFATVLGGAEGHTAIMARSLGLPLCWASPVCWRPFPVAIR